MWLLLPWNGSLTSPIFIVWKFNRTFRFVMSCQGSAIGNPDPWFYLEVKYHRRYASSPRFRDCWSKSVSALIRAFNFWNLWGFQLLGKKISDPNHVRSGVDEIEGLEASGYRNADAGEQNGQLRSRQNTKDKFWKVTKSIWEKQRYQIAWHHFSYHSSKWWETSRYDGAVHRTNNSRDLSPWCLW